MSGLPEGLTDKRRLKILKDAKGIFQQSPRTGLCSTIRKAMRKNGVNPDGLLVCDVFEGFDPVTLNASSCSAYGVFWWHIEDYFSRNKALDKLINIYKEKVEQQT